VAISAPGRNGLHLRRGVPAARIPQDIVGEALLPRVEIDGRHPLPDVHPRDGDVHAVVDLPEPPFLLPSITTYADAGPRVLASIKMTPPSRPVIPNRERRGLVAFND
jgi:hypothetical protein